MMGLPGLAVSASLPLADDSTPSNDAKSGLDIVRGPTAHRCAIGDTMAQILASLPNESRASTAPPRSVAKYTRLILPELSHADAMRDFERFYFERFLEFNSGNVLRAAAAAGLDRATFYRRARKVGAL